MWARILSLIVKELLALTRDPRGRLVLVAPTGSGKTTLARLLMGIDTPETGTVRLGDTLWNPAR